MVMRRGHLRFVASLALALAAGMSAPAAARAQNYFGQNQVQYDKFKWEIVETEHFLIHYYPEEKKASVVAARMAERGSG